MSGFIGRLINPSGRLVFSIGLIAALVLAILQAQAIYSVASNPRFGSETGYVSDETWYVPAARNIALKVFGFRTSYIDEDGRSYATIVYYSFWDRNSSLHDLQKRLAGVGGFIVKSDYEKEPIVWVTVPKDEEAIVERIAGSHTVIWGYEYPDEDGITNYLNLEHPPLAKYMVMISSLVAGDEPLYWRIPSMISAILLVVLAYLAGWRIFGLLGGLSASLLAYQEPILRSMGSVAMLDAQLALWTGAALVAVLYDRGLLAAVFSGLALATKFPGLFVAVAVFVYFIIKGRSLKNLLMMLAIIAVVYVAVNGPLITYLGPQRWVAEHISAMGWHMTSRPSGPPTSPPWGWLVNYNPFPLSLNPKLYAEVDPPAYMLTAVLAILLLGEWRTRKYAPLLFFAIIMLGYTCVYAAGNRTLYSFYATQLAPAVHASIATLLLEVKDLAWDLSSSYRPKGSGTPRGTHPTSPSSLHP